jgi:hypothetical protein
MAVAISSSIANFWCSKKVTVAVFSREMWEIGQALLVS